MYDCIFLRLIMNINRIRKLPIKRYSWEIEMKVLELNCEISEFIEKYERSKSDLLKKNLR